jgi:hypothetical protein
MGHGQTSCECGVTLVDIPVALEVLMAQMPYIRAVATISELVAEHKKTLYVEAWKSIRAKLAEVDKPACNTGSPKSAPDIVESNNLCDYCRKIIPCGDCGSKCYPGCHYLFRGRRLRAGA